MFAPPRLVDNVIIKVDPVTGYAEFPTPGDSKKHLLPIFIDPEEDNITPEMVEDSGERDFNSQVRDFWMPDRLCKLCYGCEDAFTMYRRKHHCKLLLCGIQLAHSIFVLIFNTKSHPNNMILGRMCGQIFCNQCSSHYIDGVRACRLCYEQLSERNERDNSLFRRRAPSAAPTDLLLADKPHQGQGETILSVDNQISQQAEKDKLFHMNNLQNR